MATKEEYRRAIAELIESTCPYQDALRQRLYHIGFLQALVADLCQQDSRNYYLLKRKVTALRNRLPKK